jgi:signal transduction histidine kinase
MNHPPARRALLIEDNPGDARLIQETLRQIPGRPFEADAVSTLADGLERLARESFDLLLLDLGLPDSQGGASIQKVRNHDPDLAIVVLTGLNDERVAVEALQLGAQDYLIKGDYQPNELGRSLRYAFERKQVENALREARLNEQIERQAERQRIAMDLHDGVIQDIYGVALSLETVLEDPTREREAINQSIERSIEQLHEVLVNIRSYIFELRPRQLSGNLDEDLRELARQFEYDSQIETVLQVSPDLPSLDGPICTALYHISREALGNARKHARPSRVFISAKGSHGLVVLEIRDDGVGFDASTDLPDTHRGLRNMLDRAAGIGAALSVKSASGQGTSIRVELQVVPDQSSKDWINRHVA